MQVYFDNAATTSIFPEVIQRMTEVMQQPYGNPSSTHAFGRSAKSELETSRKEIAKIIGAQASEIVFTSGGTEADNLILNSAVRDLKVRHIITTKIEHHAVLHTVNSLQLYDPLKVSYIPVLSDGSIDYRKLTEFLQQSQQSKEKTLVSLMHINNEIGTILDLQKTGALCQEYGALFHSDMVQSFGHYPIVMEELPIDFAVASAHKFHGPKGIGFAYIKKGSGIKSLIYGGSQEKGNRAGTESLHNIVGMATALKIATSQLEEDRRYIEEIKKYFTDQLKNVFPQVRFNAKSDTNNQNTYTLVNVLLPVSVQKAAMLLFQLDIAGIACSKGSACQSGSTSHSHVLQEILSEEDLQKPSLRFSFSRYNAKDEVDYFIDTLKKLV
ncbi:cysteine desulfurase [Aquimarina sp. ERC-38]|uniref:cysteine desulfurase family protein n=1 Tax=Aquimarina sp. ERC-38 TaxID=2949996 RepID=UPI002245DE78|nr:cysteine desulfurase family protein [Aquimarina sp. ERC-38]UZO79540.1 cysteine desulfurase [Aquimarina sp. ERC-38]